MITDFFHNPLGFLISFGALVVAVTIHEFAHAYLADRLGDPTPRLQGRLTLNPLAHLDPIGTILLLIARFGWGKPVQFDPFNLRNPRRDAALISLAGPVSNILLALVASIVLRLLLTTDSQFTYSMGMGVFLTFLTSLIRINVVLAIFNLLPVHPLDGFKIVGGILPEHQAKSWYELEQYGMIFLILLLLTNSIQALISPPITLLLNLFLPPII